MSVTITMAIAFWLASSYIEYRIIKAWPQVKPLFDHSFGGIVLSVVIGIGVSAVMGPVAGAGAALGQLVGLATNKITYQTYQAGADLKDAAVSQIQNVRSFMARNQELLSHAANTVRLGMKTVGVVFLTVMFIIGLPFRAVEWVQKVRAA